MSTASRAAAAALVGAPSRAAVTALGAAVLALAGYLSGDLLTGLVVLLGLLLALGWPRLLALPTGPGVTAVIALVAVAAAAAARFASLDALALVMGLAVIAAFVHEMLRRDGRPRLAESVSGAVTGAVVVVSAAGWVTAEAGPGSPLVVTAAATIAAAAAVTAVPAPTALVAGLATAAAAAAGVVAGAILPVVGMVPGGLVGLGTGIITAALHVLFGRFPASGRVRPAVAAAVLPVLVVGVPVHLVGQLLAA
ncbi:hypothetical protein MF406_16790 [Georgenia sp. TF02-10]|uniref:hypothetical protein n=1 Tax=Georgenia sp. TF02-10 TaxID=2917725 RepID=UPI001FA701E2|nr:hypothetical protein [Georgenia sp. TF02-10]UNX54523.1 hypothetical protein MF406_16790 [Georgenia sp. TF02-10]